jgi:hypothetical protein
MVPDGRRLSRMYVAAGSLASSFPHVKVVVSLFEHAVELFLKGTLAQAGKKVPTHHRLDELYGQVRSLCPGKEFEFTGAIADFVNPSEQTPGNQFARYPTDKSGKPWSSNVYIDVHLWSEQASKFRADFKRLEPLIKEHLSPSARNTPPSSS